MLAAVIFDFTSPAATALDSGALALSLHPCDALLFQFVGSASNTAAITIFDPDFSATLPVLTSALVTGSVVTTLGWGLGVGSASAFTNYVGGIPAPLPPRVQVKVASAGGAITVRCRVVSVRHGR